MAGVVAAINATKKPKRVSQEEVNQLGAEAKEFFDKLTATAKFTTPDTFVLMADDEKALLDEPSKLIEARATFQMSSEYLRPSAAVKLRISRS